MRPNEAFSSQVVSLGGSENATKRSIFKPSGIIWQPGKYDTPCFHDPRGRASCADHFYSIIQIHQTKTIALIRKI
jgi:hypothetical protein